MATAIQNLQLAQSLFDPLRQSFSRHLDTQLTAAERAAQERRQTMLANLKRSHEIEDRDAESSARERLANLSIAAQKEIEESRGRRDQVKFDAALSREDARAYEAERKARVAATRDAYAKYQAAGGTQKLEAFGPEDSSDTFYKIQEALGESVASRARSQFGALGNLMRERERELTAMTDLAPQEIAELGAAAIVSLASTNADHAKAAEFYHDRAKVVGPDDALILTRRKYPSFSAALDGELATSKLQLRRAKAESPIFVRSLQAYQADRAAITKAALESPYGSAFLDNLKDPTVQPEVAPRQTADIGNLKLPAAQSESAVATRREAMPDLANLLSLRAIMEDQGAGPAIAATNPLGAMTAVARQLVPGVARRIPSTLATADRTLSNLAASAYELQPISSDRGYLTRTGEEIGRALGNLVDSNAFITPNR